MELGLGGTAMYFKVKQSFFNEQTPSLYTKKYDFLNYTFIYYSNFSSEDQFIKNVNKRNYKIELKKYDSYK
ncbi:MAG: hypothetical protein ABL940_13290, partial [Bacteroidia bacterium]